jgi:antitoxin MazE
MKSQIIQIGNSQGVRLPKALLEESGISGEVDLVLHEEGILIRALKRKRTGWEEALKRMMEHEEDELVDSGSFTTDFDRRRWQW